MKLRLATMFITAAAHIVLAGCLSSSPQSSPESVRDPLGIDRAVNDYYFPEGAPTADAQPDPQPHSPGDAQDRSSRDDPL